MYIYIYIYIARGRNWPAGAPQTPYARQGRLGKKLRQGRAGYTRGGYSYNYSYSYSYRDRDRDRSISIYISIYSHLASRGAPNPMCPVGIGRAGYTRGGYSYIYRDRYSYRYIDRYIYRCIDICRKRGPHTHTYLASRGAPNPMCPVSIGRAGSTVPSASRQSGPPRSSPCLLPNLKMRHKRHTRAQGLGFGLRLNPKQGLHAAPASSR